MTDKQIIIDGEKLTKTGFINKFSFKLTNADLFERERICSKFFDIIQRKEQEYKQLREIMHKDFCTYYVLGECSQNHHGNCVGRNQCIKDLEQQTLF